MKALVIAFAALGFVVAAAAFLVYAGFYDVAADASHWGITQGFIASARERSIERQASAVPAPPALNDPALLAMGAEHYEEMCESCHLAPDMEDSEARAGLNPKPPKFATPGVQRDAREDFWVIKHGLRMTGMPAWGVTHDDHKIWAMAAFVNRLPGMSRADYDALVAQGRGAGHSHDEGEADHGHEHEHGEGAEPDHDHAHEDADHHHGG